jgi:hypothetical protein
LYGEIECESFGLGKPKEPLRLHPRTNNSLAAEFKPSAPEEHQRFLEFLHVPAGQIESIREHSRKGV